MSSPNSPENQVRRCVACREPAVAEYAPFCSRGCRDRDLLAWLDGGHVLPGAPLGEEDAEGLDRGMGRPL